MAEFYIDPIVSLFCCLLPSWVAISTGVMTLGILVPVRKEFKRASVVLGTSFIIILLHYDPELIQLPNCDPITLALFFAYFLTYFNIVFFCLFLRRVALTKRLPTEIFEDES